MLNAQCSMLTAQCSPLCGSSSKPPVQETFVYVSHGLVCVLFTVKVATNVDNGEIDETLGNVRIHPIFSPH